MAKKVKAEETIEVAPQVIAAEKKIAAPKKPEWDYRDRLYTLKDGRTPIIYNIASKHSQRKSLLWFDEEKGIQRELRYATNQNSPFVDEQKGAVTLGRIVFRDGQLAVPKEQVALQKLLSLYHPLKDQLYEEYNAVEESIDDLAYMEYEFQALLSAKQMEIEELEAILRVEYGSRVDDLTSSELKRDAFLFAKRNPFLFLELANDENVELRNVGIKATNAGIIKLSQDQRTFTYGETSRKLMTVPFDEHPYSALAAFFKTDEGMEVYKHIIKKL